MKVLAFGEILWDIIEGEEHLGGASFNFAVHANQCGNESFIISRLGSDNLGMRAFNLGKAHGVDVTLIQWDDLYPTGIVDVTLANGQPDYVIRENAAYDFIQWNKENTLPDSAFDVFYFGSLAQRNEISAASLYSILASNRFRHVFYDVNLRKFGYTDEIVKTSLGFCSIFKLNSDEVSVISKIIAGRVLSHAEFCVCLKDLYPNIAIIIITASERGCFIYEKELRYIPGTPVTVRDAVGAGDAFSASFMHIYAATGDAFSASKIANQVGAFVATKAGAIPEYSAEIRNVLRLDPDSASYAKRNTL